LPQHLPGNRKGWKRKTFAERRKKRGPAAGLTGSKKKKKSDDDAALLWLYGKRAQRPVGGRETNCCEKGRSRDYRSGKLGPVQRRLEGLSEGVGAEGAVTGQAGQTVVTNKHLKLVYLLPGTQAPLVSRSIGGRSARRGQKKAFDRQEDDHAEGSLRKLISRR